MVRCESDALVVAGLDAPAEEQNALGCLMHSSLSGSPPTTSPSATFFLARAEGGPFLLAIFSSLKSYSDARPILLAKSCLRESTFFLGYRRAVVRDIGLIHTSQRPGLRLRAKNLPVLLERNLPFLSL
jgi:hypothetical protein